ncbi:MAG: glycosyltransferase [Aphanothece saxicola GSE-SYN-MK-01-06B]|jgi:glycosyltransferase involved in cell wall biosynthesis|nr:glycosyltransferase [Aphanothece saxicola GSE-SYN-MK-01-06B]
MEAFPTPVALVHEWFTPRSVGGSEQVVAELDRLLAAQGAPPELYALVDGESGRPGSWLSGRRVRTSFIQRLPWGVSHVQQYLPLLPLAIEQLDLSGHPLVVSSSHLVAKGVITGPDQLHVSYVHTPARYAWDQMHPYLARSALASGPLGPLVRLQLHQLRQWDVVSSARVDALVANSRFTARRIRCFWRRRAHVLHPPVAVERFRWDRPRDDVYVSLCRLVPNKRVDVVVEAFNRTGLPLVVLGDGPERRRLEAMAGPQIRFLGRLSDPETAAWLERARAYVYAGMEDFGIAPVEAMAAGAPVIAFGQGGVLDSVRCFRTGEPGPTGLLFPEQSPACLAAALEYFEAGRLWQSLPAEGQRHWAEGFAPDVFRQRMQTLLETLWQQHRRRLRRPVPLI